MCNDPIGQIHIESIIENSNRLRMAESLKAKYNRYLRRDFTPSEARNIIGYLVVDKALDIGTFGAINRLTGKALVKAVTTLVPLGARVGAGVASVAGRSALGAALPIVTNPYVAGAALGYGALQTEPGQQLLESAEERGRMDRIRLEQALTDLSVGVKKKKSKFNTAVSRGMSAVKAGTSYGKKGVINAPKKAFAAVTKIASKINKAKKDKRRFPKAPKTPNAKKIYRSILKVLK
jgi:hypothetical protein